MLFLYIGNIVSLVIFRACKICACHQNWLVRIFTGNSIPIMCVCDIVRVLVSPLVLTDMTSSMFYGNLSYRAFRVFSLLKGQE